MGTKGSGKCLVPLVAGQATAGSEEAIQRFSKLLTYETLADARTPDHRASGYEEEFTKLLNHLEEAWPEVYRGLQVEKG
eukprot:1141262-Pelagomonas_calceolata.AAC.1